MSRFSKKSFGYIFVVLCVPLLFISIGGYLFSSYPLVEPIERDYVRNLHIERGDDFYVWYSFSESNIFKNQSLHITFDVADDNVIDFYVMSNSSFNEWKNGSMAKGTIELQGINHQDLTFEPPEYDRYYIVLDNNLYNSSKSVFLRSLWTSTLSTVNYNQSFTWLKISIISLVLLIIGSVLSKNPVNFLLRKTQMAYSKEIKKVVGQKNIKDKVEFNLKFFWFVFVLITAIVIIGVVKSYTTAIPLLQDFPELSPMITDIFIRMFIYYGLISLFLSIIFFIFSWLIDVVDKIINILYFVKVKGLRRNSELEIRASNILRKRLISSSPVPFYICTLLFFGAGLIMEQYRFPLVFISILIFSLGFSRVVISSIRQSCDELKLEWRTELKSDMPFAINSAVILIFFVPILLISIKMGFPFILDFLDCFIVNSFSGHFLPEIFSEILRPKASLVEGITRITSDAVIFSSLTFLSVFFIMFYLLPEIQRKLLTKSKLQHLVAPTIVAILAFCFNEIYYILTSSQNTGKEQWSILVSIIGFATAYLVGRAFEEAIK